MATNASTWFYAEPEHRAYLIEERVNHTLWANRINGIVLKCIQAEPPFRMTGTWNEIPVTLEWEPNQYMVLSAMADYATVEPLMLGFKEVLGFVPTLSYMNQSGQFSAEWRRGDAEQRANEVQANSQFSQIKRYKK